MPWNSPDVLIAVLMLVGVLMGIVMAVVFAVRSIGNKKSNLFFALLMLAFALSLLNIIFVSKGLQNYYPKLQFLPLRFTLSLGPFFFYFVKFSLFPSYELRRTDIKHFLLPLWQISFYLIVGFRSVEFKSQLGETFMQPFYRDFEQVLFIGSFWTYLFLAYRYIRYRLATIRNKGRRWEIQKMMWFRLVVRITVLLIGVYSFYFLSDFIGYHFFRLNLHHTSWFTYTGDLCFTAIVLWLAYAGFRIAFLDYELSPPSVSAELPPEVQIRLQFDQQKAYLDPEFRLRQLSYRLGLSPKKIESSIQQIFGQSFTSTKNTYRVEEAKQRLVHARFQHHTTGSIGLEVGFPTQKRFVQVFTKMTGLSPKAYRSKHLATTE